MAQVLAPVRTPHLVPEETPLARLLSEAVILPNIGSSTLVVLNPPPPMVIVKPIILGLAAVAPASAALTAATTPLVDQVMAELP